MSILQKITGMFRRRPVTPEDIEAHAQAKLLREQMLQDRTSQRSGGTYRSGGR
jgi:hypothetical protein